MRAGRGLWKRRQEKPHAHWVGTSPDNRFVFVPDLGMDKVVIYRLDVEKADLTPHGFGQCPAGGGPRHMKFGANGKFVYVLNELELSVTVFAYDAEKGTMTALQTIPTVSEEAKAKEMFVSSSEIRVHPSGKFVYAANRGHDTITAFRVDEATGKLALIEIEPVRGGWPRNFNVDPTGEVVAGGGDGDSNNIAVFAIDGETGELAYTRVMVMVSDADLCDVRGVSCLATGFGNRSIYRTSDSTLPLNHEVVQLQSPGVSGAAAPPWGIDQPPPEPQRGSTNVSPSTTPRVTRPFKIRTMQ